MLVATPLVSRDLDAGRCAADVAHALLMLEKRVDEILDRIKSRSEQEQVRVGRIQDRVTACAAKVVAIAGMKNRATTVMSTSRYPDGGESKEPTLLVEGEPSDEGVHAEIGDDEACTLAEDAGRESAVVNDELHAGALELWSRINPYGGEAVRVELVMEDEGLGAPSVTRSARSVGALLLFNSASTPYRAYHARLDNLEPDERKRQVVAQDEDDELPDAPESILKGVELPDVAQLDYQYKPELGELAKLDLPENLPLPDIADVTFGADLPVIAPSAHQQNLALPNLLPSGPDFNASLPVGAGAAPGTEPPPPPPPAPPAPVAEAEQPPPPPPPPPPVADETPKPPPPVPEHADKETAGAKVDLMSAIKGFSVDELRKQEESDVKKTEAKKAKPDAPMSMLDEMRARMNRRQKALSGKTQHDDNEPTLPPQKPRPPPPPPLPRANSKKPPPVINDDDDDDFDAEPVRSSPRLPTRAEPAATDLKPKQPPPPRDDSGQSQSSRKGSLFDQDNQVLNKMLAPPWRGNPNDDDDDDDDWNDDASD